MDRGWGRLAAGGIKRFIEFTLKGVCAKLSSHTVLWVGCQEQNSPPGPPRDLSPTRRRGGRASILFNAYTTPHHPIVRRFHCGRPPLGR